MEGARTDEPAAVTPTVPPAVTPAVADEAVALVIAQIPLRPQAVLLIVFGDYLVEPGTMVAASSIVAVLDAVGVGEAAARATLSRMVRRGLLHRVVHGRRALFGLTDHGRRTTLGGRSRVREGQLVAEHWDGSWTVVGFSMPEAWQRERHDLRARLLWAGFGMIQSGLWVCPRRVDVVAALDGLGLDEHVRVFDAVPAAPTEAARLVADAYDLPELARRYTAFVDRWARFAPVGSQGDPTNLIDPAHPTGVDRGAGRVDAFSRRLVLAVDWLQMVRADPRLPLAFLPPQWPAVDAEALYRSLDDALQTAAQRQAGERLDLLGG